MLFADKLTLTQPRKTADGYLAVRARAARSGVYEYNGSEIDPEGEHFQANDVVNVYRSEDEVFDKDAVASFLMKPVTNDHPDKPITAGNWRAFAKGVVGKALRDGDFLAFDIVLMDAATIKAVEDGKRELSNGYASKIVFEEGVTPDGHAYQARQTMIRGNHVAVVDKGRAGSACRIGDCEVAPIPAAELIEILTDGRPYNDKTNDHINGATDLNKDGVRNVATKMITFDGLPLEVTDAAEAAITKLQGQITTLTDAKVKAEGELTDTKTKLVERDAEIVTLKQSVEDAKVTPDQLRDAAKSYALVCDKAKALGVEFADDADADAIMKAVVDAKMGDAAKGYEPKDYATAFAVLTKDAKVEQTDPVRAALKNGVKSNDARTDIQKQRAAWLADKQTAYRGQPQGVN